MRWRMQQLAKNAPLPAPESDVEAEDPLRLPLRLLPEAPSTRRCQTPRWRSISRSETFVRSLSPSDSLIGANFGNFRKISEEVFKCLPEEPVIALPKWHGSEQARWSFHRWQIQNSLPPHPTLCFFMYVTDFSFKRKHENTACSREDASHSCSREDASHILSLAATFPPSF